MFLKFTLRNIVDFQHCVNLGCIAKSFSYTNICIYILFIFFSIMIYHRISNIVTWAIGFQSGTSGKEPTCQWRKHKTCGFDPWVRKVPGGGHGNPLQYFCLENLMNRGAWQSPRHRFTKSWTRLKRLSMHVCIMGINKMC